MRIATFNINNVNKRLANLLDWLAGEKPDVVCLQELKAEDRAFPLAAIEAAGYGAVWRGQRTWNGVAILARGATPVITRRALPGDPSAVFDIFTGKPVVIMEAPQVGLDIQDASDLAELLDRPAMRADRKLRQ